MGDQAESSASSLRSVTDLESEEEYNTEGENNDDIDGNTNDQDINIQLAILIPEFVSKIREMAILKLLNPKQKIGDIHYWARRECRFEVYSAQKCLFDFETRQSRLCFYRINQALFIKYLNFASPKMRDIYNELIPPEEMKEINRIRKQKKDLIAHDERMNVEIKQLLDELKPYAMKGDVYQLRTKIDELEYQETNKRSSKYQLLNVVEIM